MQGTLYHSASRDAEEFRHVRERRDDGISEKEIDHIEKYGKMHEYYDGDTCEGVHNLGFQSWNLLAVNMYEYLKQF